MSKISSWSADILSPAPFLAAATQDETLELRPSPDPSLDPRPSEQML